MVLEGGLGIEWSTPGMSYRTFLGVRRGTMGVRQKERDGEERKREEREREIKGGGERERERGGGCV